MTTLTADEHIPQAVVSGLRARGIEVLGVVEQGLGGVADRDLLARCQRDRRVLLTNDHDFLGLPDDVDHAGIIYLTTQFASIGDVIRAVVRLLDTTPEEAFAGRVFYVP